jgi:uncharacterized protein
LGRTIALLLFMPGDNIVTEALNYVRNLFEQQEQPKMYFHNLKHTLGVFYAATEISENSGLNTESLTLVQLAALFHDTGYLYYYAGHEDNSKLIAGNFLLQRRCPPQLIDQVLACIDATKIPQQPQNIEQQIMCDADLFHFASPDYLTYADNLKKEWEAHLGKSFTEIKWAQTNLDLLKRHQYFTSYCQSTLQQGKENNIALLQNFLNAN